MSRKKVSVLYKVNPTVAPGGTIINKHCLRVSNIDLKLVGGYFNLAQRHLNFLVQNPWNS